LDHRTDQKKLICPRCKSALEVAATPAPTWSSRPAPEPEPEPDETEPREEPTPPRSAFPLWLVLGSISVFILLVAAGGVLAWRATRSTPAQVEATTPAPTTTPTPTPTPPSPPPRETPGPRPLPGPGSKDPRVLEGPPAPQPKPEPKPEPKPAPKPREPESAPAPGKALTGEEINLRLLKSTAFIVTAEAGGIGCGSGSLIHADRKLVLTNYHVVGETNRTLVFFPEYDGKKELITSPRWYFDGLKKVGMRGKVIARNPRLDLAVLELDKLPEHIVELPLSVRPAATGSSVYSLGGSGVNLRGVGGAAADAGALWRLTTGTVRGRHRETHQYSDGQRVDAMMLETQSPVNPGDSGGPTVNDRGELVGVVASYSSKDRLVSQSIDLTEVREFLEFMAKKQGWEWPPAEMK
jgi:hypothetical protein